jgi:hypothetical protein
LRLDDIEKLEYGSSSILMYQSVFVEELKVRNRTNLENESMVRLLVVFWDPSMSLPHLGWLGIDSAMFQHQT